MSSKATGKTVTLVYQPHARFFPAERRFEGLNDDDMVFTVAALAGRRMHTPHHGADLVQLRETRRAQLERDAMSLTDSLYDGLGRWVRLIPRRVLARVLQLQMDWFLGTTASWTYEIVGLHAELTRRQPTFLRPARSAPENGPRILCTVCTTDTLLSVELPEGWTKDEQGLPHCPEHPALKPQMKGTAA